MLYIYMESTAQPISEDKAAKQQQRVAELRRYNRDYYHAHKKASECEHCKKTFSSVNALMRHQAKTPQVQAAASDGDHREVHDKRINNRYRLVGVVIPIRYHTCIYHQLVLLWDN